MFDSARRQHQQAHDSLLKRTGGGENPYLIHQELGNVMTKAATVVRRNDTLAEAYATVCELEERAEHCSLSDTGNWTNQNVVFTKALLDMLPLAKVIVKGALQRDECRGAHFKPEFEMPGLKATDQAEHRREAEAWCDRFEENTRKWFKSTVATYVAGRRPGADLRGSRYDLDPPAAKAVWAGRGGSDRGSVERASAAKAGGGHDGNGSPSKSAAKPVTANEETRTIRRLHGFRREKQNRIVEADFEWSPIISLPSGRGPGEGKRHRCHCRATICDKTAQ